MAVQDRPVLPPETRPAREDENGSGPYFPGEGAPAGLQNEVAAILSQFAEQVAGAANERQGSVRVYMLGLFSGAGLVGSAVALGVMLGRWL
jgi:hypothetical protein